VRWFFADNFDNSFLGMQESTFLNRYIFQFVWLGWMQDAMICFGFSGAVVSVGLIIGILVVADITHWLSFFGRPIQNEERAK